MVPIPVEHAHQRFFDISLPAASEDQDSLPLIKTTAPLGEVSAYKKSQEYAMDVSVQENKPFKGVKLVGVDRSRFSGYGDYFEVLLPHGYVVPIQADIFFEAILRDGFNHTTQELNSEFIFASVRRTVKLVRAGSVFERAAEERKTLAGKEKLNIKTMSVGEVYQTATGRRAVFLGFVSTKYLTRKRPSKQKLASDVQLVKIKLDSIELKYSSHKLATIWWPCDRWLRRRTLSNEVLQENLDSFLKRGSSFRSITFLSANNPGFVNKIEDIRADVPDDIIVQIKRNTCHDINRRIEENEKQKTSHSRLHILQSNKWWLEGLIKDTRLANMIVFGMKPDAKNPLFDTIIKLTEIYNSEIEEAGNNKLATSTITTVAPPRPLLWANVPVNTVAWTGK
jgi:hypothetical protein